MTVNRTVPNWEPDLTHDTVSNLRGRPNAAMDCVESRGGRYSEFHPIFIVKKYRDTGYIAILVLRQQ